MKNKWVVPLIFLIVLLALGAFRWQEVASKTLDSGVDKWRVDRWTGQIWLEQYSEQLGVRIRPVGEGVNIDTAYGDKEAITIWWELGLIICTVWLCISGLISPYLQKRRKNKQGIKQSPAERGVVN